MDCHRLLTISNCILFQWGRTYVNKGATQYVTLNIAYNNTYYGGTAISIEGTITGAGDSYTVSLLNLSNEGFNIQTAANVGYTHSWFTYGYN